MTTPPESLSPRSLKDYAQTYMEVGFSFIPLHPPGGEQDGKRPRLRTWQSYSSRKPTQDEVSKWLSEKPEPNLAIVTGSVSNLVVLDIDDEQTHSELMPFLGDLSTTFTVKTGKGVHLYFRPLDRVVRTSPFRMNDRTHHLKGEGGYVVAPPSRHMNGRTYEVALKAPPRSVWLSSLTKAIEDAGGIFAFTPGTNQKPIQWASQLCQPLGEGGRNNAAAQLCGLLIRKFPSDPDLIMGLMTAWNGTYCKPPLSTRELTTLVESEYERYKDRD